MKRVRLYRRAPLAPVPPSTASKVWSLLLESVDLLGRGLLVCTIGIVLFIALLATLPGAPISPEANAPACAQSVSGRTLAGLRGLSCSVEHRAEARGGLAAILLPPRAQCPSARDSFSRR